MDNAALQPTTTNILLDPTKLARSHRSNVGASMGDCTLASRRSMWAAGVRWEDHQACESIPVRFSRKGAQPPCALSAGPLLLLFSLSEKCHYTVAKNTDTGMA